MSAEAAAYTAGLIEVGQIWHQRDESREVVIHRIDQGARDRALLRSTGGRNLHWVWADNIPHLYSPGTLP